MATVGTMQHPGSAPEATTVSQSQAATAGGCTLKHAVLSSDIWEDANLRTVSVSSESARGGTR